MTNNKNKLGIYFISILLLLAAACNLNGGATPPSGAMTGQTVIPASPLPSSPVLTALPTTGKVVSPLPSITKTQTKAYLPYLVNTEIPTTTPIVVGPVVGGPSGTEGYPWWNDTVFYEIDVCSFYDSNGDGIGDFNGVTEKLDYLKDLGITGLWLMPINPSVYFPGYGTDDYYSVNPKYGTLEDFKRLLAEAHKRGIRVIIDRVLHDTSSQHPWFIAAQDSNSPYRQWYMWSKTDQGLSEWGTQVWFKTPSGYYFSLFGPDNPHLDLTNPSVTAEVNKITQYWLQIGVDGFRLDAAPNLITEGRTLVDTPSDHTWLRAFYTFYKGINPNAFTVGEVWKEPASSLATYTGDQVDITFEFNIAGAIIDSIKSGSNSKINASLQQANKNIPRQQFAPFITNHDMDRSMTILNSDPEKAKVAASLLLTSSGVPFMYFGEEIGMEGTIKNENGLIWCWNQNTPMQWSSGMNAGFTAGSPWFKVDPNYAKFNVSDEMKNPASLFSHYKALISLRNTHPALRIGSLNIVSSANPGLFASLRVSSTEASLVLINLTNAPINNFDLSLDKSPLRSGKYSALPLMGQGSVGDLNVISTGGFSNYGPIPTIPAYATVIIQFNPK